jgi:hypothetical protein|nr:MAG TPA: hypothetical protein [Caudoviricetes sp.]
MVNVGKMLVTSHMGDTSAEVMLEINGYEAYALGKSNSSDSIKRVVLNAIKNDMFTRTLGEPKCIGTLDWGTRRAVPAIDRVIFHYPATIVYWKDGTKTVFKCQREKFDKEKGLLAASAKKVYGNKGSFNNIIKRFVEE